VAHEPRVYLLSPRFGRSLEGRAFRLQRERGNLLVHSSSTVEADPQAIEELGRIEREYPNQSDEARAECD
jgi:hypothetical protein